MTEQKVRPKAAEPGKAERQRELADSGNAERQDEAADPGKSEIPCEAVKLLAGVNRIWNHPLYRQEYAGLQELERDRIWCGHDLQHFLDTARLMWIRNLEEGGQLKKDLIYAAALLHDLGRARQYTDGTPHDEAGVQLAEEILPACGYTATETRLVCAAIAGHRGSCRSGMTVQTEQAEAARKLAAYLYRADKESRNCMICSAADTCNWPEKKKNLTLKG